MAGLCNINADILKSSPGISKLVQIALALSCHILLRKNSEIVLLLGSVHPSFQAVAVSCLFTSSLILASYVLSANSVALIRGSLLEVLFNSVAFCLYISHAIWLLIHTVFILGPLHLILPFGSCFPTMVTVGILGFLAALIHAVDGCITYRLRS